VIRVDDGLREYIEKNSFKHDVIETDFELLMGTITGLEEKNGKLEKQLAESIPKSEIKKILSINPASGWPNSRESIIRKIKKLTKKGD
jgi:hypothetical protein